MKALYQCTKEVKKHLSQWLEASPVFAETDSYGDHGFGRRKRKKIHVHFSLISTEYHLCNLNDVHHRSPTQSLLKKIEALGNDSITYNSPNKNDEDLDYLDIYDDYDAIYSSDNDPVYYNERQREIPAQLKETGLVETSWSFQYATYPFIYAKDETTVFLGRCFLLNEELMPVYVNMRGVIEKVSETSIDKN